MEIVELLHRFHYHPPLQETTKDLHQDIRSRCWGLASYLNDRLPDGREKSLAITHLEEVMFWSNAAIARNQS